MSEPATKGDKLIGGIVQTLFADLHDTTELRIRLAEDVGFSRGRSVGYAEGYRACQRNVTGAFNLFTDTAGITEQERCE